VLESTATESKVWNQQYINPEGRSHVTNLCSSELESRTVVMTTHGMSSPQLRRAALEFVMRNIRYHRVYSKPSTHS